jgi:hypothetical protein
MVMLAQIEKCTIPMIPILTVLDLMPTGRVIAIKDIIVITKDIKSLYYFLSGIDGLRKDQALKGGSTIEHGSH